MKKIVCSIFLLFAISLGFTGCNGKARHIPGMPSGVGPEYESRNGENGQKLKIAQNILTQYQNFYTTDTTELLKCVAEGIRANQCPNQLRLIRSTYYVHSRQYDKGLAELDSLEPEVMSDIYGPTFIDGIKLRIAALKARSEGDDSTYRKLIHDGTLLTGSYIADHKEQMVEIIKGLGMFYDRSRFPISTLTQYLLFQIEDDKKEYAKFAKEMKKAVPNTEMIFDNIEIMADFRQEYYGC